ncbi:alpha/beta hydrolase [Bacillus sp. FJAT-45066]|uniref:alpha/beta hydrolase n=1 Tax=Bacillus sp. FJAT-45066 TaxID=2011010 RepID=UPI000BB961FA|nr:alpha/beta hydrolase-fold protein [Bacillus sp. FJAT-45066]
MENIKGQIEERILYSDALKEDMTLMIYKPANYSPLYKYHVLIAQDGQDYFSMGRIASLADELLGNKEIQNIIIIGVPYKDVQDRKEKYHPKGSKHKGYLRFLGHELTSYLDKEFPTYQMGMGRGLIGDSLAGTVSLLAALHYPNTFGNVILQSPYVNNYVLDKVGEFNETHLLTMYHVIGTEETDVKTTDGKTKDFVIPNRDLHKLMKEKNFTVSYEEFEGDHTWTYWQPDLRKALKVIYR